MLVKRKGKWMLISKSNPKKVLKHFGTKKPSEEAVAHEEKRVSYFKHRKSDKKSKLFGN